MLAASPAEEDGHARRCHGGTVAVGGLPTPTPHYRPSMDKTRLELSTVAVTAGRPARTPDAPLNTPIVPASSFVAGGPTEYAREGGPTIAAFEELVAGLESVQLSETARAIAFSSGMAAADALLDLVPLRGRVIAPTTTYTGVAVRLRELHAKGTIDLTLVDVTDTARIEQELATKPSLLWLESPTNPLLEVADLPRLLAAATTAGVRSVVDNTFATPVLQRPLEWGADVVLHSATKGLSGHSDLLMGVLVTSDAELHEQLHVRRILLGAAPSPFDTYLAMRGARTLALRVDRGRHTAELLASRLADLEQISDVRHFGTMISIQFHGDADLAEAVCTRTSLWVHATSLGGVESSLERRRRWALESTHVPEDLVRLSVGIEDPEDLWTDLRTAIQG